MATIVLCLEGCHGSGKTALTKQFRDMGFTVMDEGFMSQPTSLLHPQSLLMETTWVCGWFHRLMNHIQTMRRSGTSTTNQIIIADRSPFSAVFYSRTDGHLLEPLIRQYMKELKEVADVHVHTVHLRTERALLWDRIQARLQLEPERAALREDRMDWMDKVLDFYDSLSWDITLANNETTMCDLVEGVMQALRPLSPAVAGVVAANEPVVRLWRSKSQSSSPCSSPSCEPSADAWGSNSPTYVSATSGTQVCAATPLTEMFDNADIACTDETTVSESYQELSVSSDSSSFVTPIKPAREDALYHNILESPIKA